jgi:hypothetical protein
MATKKSAKKPVKKAAAAKPDKGPGVIASIVEFLQAASAKSALSKEALLGKLAKRFPDRSPDCMAKTINAQVPGRLRKERELDVQKNDDGYWIK